MALIKSISLIVVMSQQQATLLSIIVAAEESNEIVNYNDIDDNSSNATATASINDNIVRLKCDNDYGGVACTFFNINIKASNTRTSGYDYWGGQTAGYSTNSGGNGLMYPPEMKTYIKFIESRLERIPIGLFQHYTNVLEFVAPGVGLHKLDNESFVGAQYLEVLDLSSNRIDGTLTSDVLKNVSNVKKIDLSKNELRQIDAGAFSDLYKLNYLDLSVNKIEFLPDELFQPLGALEVLSLAHNRLQQISSAHFTSTTNIVYLSLDSNQLEHIDTTAFNHLGNLQYLHLSQNRLTEFNHRLLHAKHLYVNHNQLKLLYVPAGVQVLDAQFNNLSELECDAEPIGTMQTEIAVLNNNDLDDFHCVSKMIRLSILNLAHNRLRRVQTSTFGQHTGMTVLQLDHNRLTIIERDAFNALQALEFLDLSQNWLKALDLNIFPHDEIKLQTLFISANPIDELEKCHIIFQLESVVEHDGSCSENDTSNAFE